MSFPQQETVDLTTSSGGAVTAYSSVIRGTIRHLRYQPGDIATGATLTVSLATSGVELLTKANAGTSDVTFSPGQKVSEVGDGSDALYSTGNEVRVPVTCAQERVKVVIASGGDTKTGAIIIVWD